MRFTSILSSLCLCLLFCNASLAANSYDKFYGGDGAFRDLDKRLNVVYKNLRKNLKWSAANSLMFEQRYWHDKLFPILTADAAKNNENTKAALAVLKKRVPDLEKLENSAREDILGLDIEFGMSEDEVAKRLGIKDVSLLKASSGDDDAYKIKLFGSVVPLYFQFMHTSFNNSQPDTKNGFTNFTKALKSALGFPVNELPSAPLPEDFNITTLVSLSTGELESRSDFISLNEFLEKKYKIAYPASIGMRILLDEKYGNLCSHFPINA